MILRQNYLLLSWRSHSDFQQTHSAAAGKVIDFLFLYSKKKVMYENKRRPSITLVVRHRRIGYDLCCLLHLSLFVIESGLWNFRLGINQEGSTTYVIILKISWTWLLKLDWLVPRTCHSYLFLNNINGSIFMGSISAHQ